MKTTQLSLLVISPLLLTLASGCGAFDKRNSEKAKQEAAAKTAAEASSAQIPDEVSLKEDRAELDELRKDIPEDVKRENDEIAFILKNMATMEEEPSKVRDRFQTALRKRREKMDKTLRKERETFTSNERSKRDEFLTKLKEEREDFSSKKPDAKERKKFFDKQESDRKEYFSEQSDKRKDFESNITERRKTFEDYVREQSNKFNQEHRAYSQAFNERRRELSKKKEMEQKAKRMEQQGKRSGPAGILPGDLPSAPPESGNSGFASSTEADRKLLEEMNQPRTEKAKPLRAGDDGQ